jgi:hypothetical protein
VKLGRAAFIAESLGPGRLRQAAGLLCVAFLFLPLGGCGGIEFKGKIFDYAGLTGEKQQSDVQMASRPPLVVPPNTHYLPPPGSEPVAPTVADWPTNPETERQQLLAQKTAEERKKAAETDPTNPYAGKPTLLDKVLGRGKDTQEASVSDVPEPDPSDSLPPVNQTKTAKADQPYHAPGITTPDDDDDPFHPKVPNTYDAVNNGTYRGM